MDWVPLNINTPAERDAVILAPYHVGYTARQRRRKDGQKAVVYVEYMKER